MKIVIRNGRTDIQTTWDPNEHPIAIVLTPRDKANIANMHPDATIYAAFPEGWDRADVVAWLDRLKAEVEPWSSLGEEFPKEQARLRRLLVAYKSGATGLFCAAMIESTLRMADEAAASGNVVDMIAVFGMMKEITG